MAGDTQITIVGNLVSDPELRFTPSGAAVCNFRIASTPRSFDKTTNEWKDGESLFLTCNVWRQPAENCAESLQKGMRVIVQGNLRQRSYDTKEGEKRTVYEIEVDEVGPSLRNATAQVTKAQRQQGQGGQQQSGQRPPQGQQQQNGWGSAPPPQQRQPQGAGAGWGAPQGQQSGGFSAEPPF
jgi:single-strand DNA-binding protein